MHAGQGRPVPPSVGKGAWLIENQAFLNVDEPGQGLVTYGIPPVAPTGAPCLSVSAHEVAWHLGVDVAQLLEANASGSLGLLQEFDNNHRRLILEFALGGLRYDVVTRSFDGFSGTA